MKIVFGEEQGPRTLQGPLSLTSVVDIGIIILSTDHTDIVYIVYDLVAKLTDAIKFCASVFVKNFTCFCLILLFTKCIYLHISNK